MHQAEARALRHATILLLCVSVVRWAWSRGRTEPANLPGRDVGAELLDSSRVAARDTELRSRPLAPNERVDPNEADEATLDRLPGVGPATASRIVEARRDVGPFRTPEDLLRVRGIGPRSLERLRPHLDLPGRGGTVSRRSSSSGAAPSPRRARASPLRKVDINRADRSALESLHGVGPALAERIIAARRERPFASVEELTRVPGIGPATLRRLRDRAVVR